MYLSKQGGIYIRLGYDTKRSELPVKMGLKDIEFFYCYSPYLADHIIKCGVKSITVAINPNTKSVYTMFLKSVELQDAIDCYKSKGK